jgi:hypothetical protein
MSTDISGDHVALIFLFVIQSSLLGLLDTKTDAACSYCEITNRHSETNQNTCTAIKADVRI